MGMAHVSPAPPADGPVAQVRHSVQDLLQADAALSRWCTDLCVSRYLAARCQDVPKASKMLRHTLQWRLKCRPEEIRWEDVQHIGTTGRVEQLRTPDNEGRPVVVMRLRFPLAHASNEQLISFLLFTLERSSRLADRAGTGKMTWLLDMKGYSNRTAPPLAVSIQTVQILQAHYPERLALGVVCRPNMLFRLLWRAVSPFMDDATRAKVVFVERSENCRAALAGLMPLTEVDTCIGGDREAAFDFHAYCAAIQREEAALVAEKACAADCVS